MLNAKAIRVFFCAVMMFAAPVAKAQEDASEESVMLPCDGRCATITPPQRISHVSMTFPLRFAIGRYSEAIVEHRYTVLPDGHVGDVAIVSLLGPPEFAEAAKRALLQWTFKPATLNGQPVAVSMNKKSVFSVEGRQIRGAIASLYEASAVLIQEGKLDEAKARLSEALRGESRLNFYERGMLTYLLTLIAVQHKDFAEVRFLTSVPLLFPDDVLPLTVMRNLYRHRIVALLNLGDMVGASRMLARIKRMAGFDPADPLAQQVADMQKRIDGLPAFSALARIPPADSADGYNFELYRRKFTFTNIKGDLQRYTLSCKQARVESPISEKAEWSVPGNWSDCNIFVHGTPGTTFDIVQFAN